MKAKLYRTAKTLCQIGAIPADTYVAVTFAYTDVIGRNVFHINTALLTEEHVLESYLTNFVL